MRFLLVALVVALVVQTGGGLAQEKTEPAKGDKFKAPLDEAQRSYEIALAHADAAPQEPSPKDGKDEPLYQGKPASFWLVRLKDRDASFRLEAVKALREIGTDAEGVVVALVKTLADKDATVRDAAGEAINSFSVEGKIPALIDILRGNEKSAHRASIELLGEIGAKAKQALPELTKALGNEDATIRLSASQALGKIGSAEKSALAALIKLFEDKENSVRLEAVQSVGKIGKGTETAIPSLVERLSPKKEDNASVRLEVVRTLWIVGRQDEKALLAIIAAACSDPDYEKVRKEAATLISKVEAKTRVPLLVQLLKTDDKLTRLSVLHFLVDIGAEAKTAVAAVAEVLKSDDNSTRLVALQFLVNIGAEAKAAVPAVADMLKIEDESVRILAARMLGKVGKEAAPAVPALIGLATDPRVRAEAIRSVKAIPVEAKLAALTSAIKDKNIEVREFAIREIQEIGAEANIAIPPLLERLSPNKEEQPFLRQEAVKTLWILGKQNEKVLEGILRACGDPNEQVANEARAAIPRVEVKTRIQLLEKSLKTDDTKVRLAALQFLVDIGAEAKTAVPAVVEVLKTDDNKTRQVALQFLVGIGAEAKAAVPAVADMLKIEDENVRILAARMLGKVGKDAAPAVPALIGLVATQSPKVTEEAQKSVRAIPVEAKLPALAAALQQKNAEVQVYVLGELQEIGAEAKSCVPAVLEVLKSDDENVRIQAARLLGKIEKDAAPAIPALIRLVLDQSPKVVEEARKSVRAIPVGAKLPSLIEALKDKNIAVQVYVLGELHEIGAEAQTAVPAVIEVLKNGADRTRLVAVQVLVKIGPEARAAVPQVAQLLNSDEEPIRVEAAKMLGKIGNDAAPAVPALIGLVAADKSALVRAEAAHSIKALPGEAKLPALVAALKSNHVAIQLFALGEMQEIGAGAKAAVPAVADMLKNENESVRIQAARMLGKVGKDAHPAALALLDMLGEKSPELRAEASTAFCQIVYKGKEWLEQHEQSVKIAKKGGVDVLFLGNERWEIPPPSFNPQGPRKSLESLFPNIRAADFAIKHFGIKNGTQFVLETQFVLWSLQNGELDGIQPKVAVLKIVPTDVFGNLPVQKDKEIADGIMAIVKAIQEKSPKTRVLVLGILPNVNEMAGTPTNRRIDNVNKIIAKLDNGNTVRFLDGNLLLLSPEERLGSSNTVRRGREAERIMPVLKEMLGADSK